MRSPSGSSEAKSEAPSVSAHCSQCAQTLCIAPHCRQGLCNGVRSIPSAHWPQNLCSMKIIVCRLGLILPISETHMVWTCAAPAKLLEEAGVKFDPSNGGAFRASTQAVASSPENALEVLLASLSSALCSHRLCLLVDCLARCIRCLPKIDTMRQSEFVSKTTENVQRCVLQVADHTDILVSIVKQTNVSTVAEHVICPECPQRTDQPTLLRRGAWCCSRTTLTSWLAS